MRLDKYLKVSRIIKRRSVAADACSAGRINLNGRVAKAGDRVKVGDRIEVNLGTQPQAFEVLEIKEHALKDEAGLMFKRVDA